MNTQLEIVLQAARTLPPAELPLLLGDLEVVRATAYARLSAAPAPVQSADELLTVAQAAQKLGCSKYYLYKTTLPFLRRLGRKRMFSKNGIEAYLAKQR
jgi:excisionase family DNA binding protein